MAKVDDRIKQLSLSPLPVEGGFFRFIHLFGDSSGAIYYLVTKDSFSSLHKLAKDEVWFFLEGGKCEQLTLTEGGSIKIKPLDENNRTTLVKAEEWQATRLVEGEYALFSTVMSPHYEAEDFSSPSDELLEQYPLLKEWL